MDTMGSSSSSKRSVVFDLIRRRYVKATPEEQVRQQWLQRMVGPLGFPKELIVVEKALKELPHLISEYVPDRRLDILCYSKGIHPSYPLYPLLLLECKEDQLTQDALDQVIGYNAYVKAPFIGAVGIDAAEVGYFDRGEDRYRFCSVLPSFKELLAWAKR